MQACENCGNTYDKAFKVVLNNSEEHVFDSFECAINAIAPHCANCDLRIIGHGVEAGDEIFCCVHCSEMTGKTGLRDRI